MLFFEVPNLTFGQLRCEHHEPGLHLRDELVDLQAHVGIYTASLVSGDVIGQPLLHLLQQGSVLRQHLIAVPLVQVAQFAAQTVCLGVGQVEIVVQPPIHQLRGLVVGQFDGAAALQEQHARQQGKGAPCGMKRKQRCTHDGSWR